MLKQLEENADEDELDFELMVGSISRCPSGWTQRGRICCKNKALGGTGLCCRMDGTGCYCPRGRVIQGRRGRANGCGSEHSSFPWWVSKAFTAELHDVCVRHDNCYTDCRASQQRCDGNWYREAKQECWDSYGNCKRNWWSCTLNWIVAGGPLGWCHARIAAMYDGMVKSNAWMISMGESCGCS